MRNGEPRDRAGGASVLPSVIARLTAPSMFWLDGHFSAGVTHGANDANPLLAELAAISTSNVGPHVVAIDNRSQFWRKIAPPFVIR